MNTVLSDNFSRGFYVSLPDEMEEKAMEYWMYGLPGNKEISAKFLKDVGVTRLITGADPNAIAAANAVGLRVYVFTGAYGIYSDDNGRFLSVDIQGKSQKWFNSNCPSQPVVRERNLARIKELAKMDNIDGVFIDGARFASPASGFDAFFTCFCEACRQRAEDFGFDFERIKKDVNSLYEYLNSEKAKRRDITVLADLVDLLFASPGILEWFRFRSRCTTEHMANIRHVLKSINNKHQLGMFIFTPVLADIVGQSYVELRDIVDVFSPMIYRNISGIAALNEELSSICTLLAERFEWDRDTTAKLVLLLTNFCGVTGVLSAEEIASELPPEVICVETKRARAYLGTDKELVPIISLQDEYLKGSVEAVRSGGANGVSFFAFRNGTENYVRLGLGC